MSAHEMTIALEWLYSTLSGDTTLSGYAPGGVWRAEAPPSTNAPYVIFAHQSGQGRDEVIFGGGRAYSEMQFEVLAVGPAKVSQAIASAAARVDTLLTVAAQTAVTGGTLLSSYRIQPSEADTLVDGEMWTNMGGVYLLRIKAT